MEQSRKWPEEREKQAFKERMQLRKEPLRGKQSGGTFTVFEDAVQIFQVLNLYLTLFLSLFHTFCARGFNTDRERAVYFCVMKRDKDRLPFSEYECSLSHFRHCTCQGSENQFYLLMPSFKCCRPAVAAILFVTLGIIQTEFLRVFFFLNIIVAFKVCAHIYFKSMNANFLARAVAQKQNWYVQPQPPAKLCDA